MASEKAWYWVAVGVLAVLMGNNFLARHQDSVRCLAGQSLAALNRISSGSDRLISVGEMMLGRGETNLARTQTAVSRAQTRVVSIQTAMARQQCAWARIQAERSQIAERAQVMVMEDAGPALRCPRQSLQLDIPVAPAAKSQGTI